MGLILATLTGGGDAAAGEPTTPFERAVSTPRGQLKSPYPDFASVAAEGLKIYRSHDYYGCHEVVVAWRHPSPIRFGIYGADDDALFRVITLGTGSLSPGDAFRKQGFVRKGGLRPAT